MILNISRVRVEDTYFRWLSRLFDDNKITKLIVSESQAKEIFGAALGIWKTYRGVPVEVVAEKEEE